jgi:AcrR family transcriptional regulator
MPRQPSIRAHEDVLAAALKLIADRGIEGVSVDAIAKESGVSKATIYKHWTNKEALCLEAINKLRHELPANDEDGDPRAEIVRLLCQLTEAQRPKLLARIMPKILGHASNHPKFAKAWGDRVEQPRRARLRQLVERAVAEGALRRDTDVEFAVHLLLGPVLYHRLMRTTMPPDMPERIVNLVWAANAPGR